MKYDRSGIFKKAWSYVRNFNVTMSDALRRAWQEAKTPNLLASVVQKLTDQMEAYKAAHPGTEYVIQQKNWAKNGNDRSYLSITVQEPGKKRQKRDCGYIDNIKGIYVAAYAYDILHA